MIRLAIQTYTVRKDLKKDLPRTLCHILSLGVRDVELARVHFDAEVARRVRNNGSSIAAIQVKPRLLERDFAGIVGFCRTVGCPTVVASVLPTRAILGGRKAVLAFARRLDRLAERYGREGIAFAFHNHAFEFATVGGTTKFDLLVAHTAPTVGFVLDTYWTARSGVDPVRFIGRLGPRCVGLHLRDYVPATPGRKAHDGAPGEGVIDFAAVLRAATYARHAAIEVDSKTPWVSLENAVRHLEGLRQDDAVKEVTTWNRVK